jgi:magnesium chelatase subunit I
VDPVIEEAKRAEHPCQPITPCSIPAPRNSATTCQRLAAPVGWCPRRTAASSPSNELLDLAERIQVSLLKLMEEMRHSGPRLHPAAAAGRAPSRQRQPRALHQPGQDHHPAEGPFGAEIRTHYPREMTAEIALVAREADLATIGAEVGEPTA